MDISVSMILFFCDLCCFIKAELQGKLTELKRQVAEIRQRRASQEQSESSLTDPEQKVGALI